MYTVSHDYYAILGVSKNATTEEITRQYRKLMRKHHPDQFKGLRAKYQEEGDQDLLRVIDERIREAEERCKLLNEAFEVLSDPLKRKQYDDQTVEPSVPLPEISIHPTRITFGSLLEGQEKSLGFTIENKGGPPTAVNIDWEGNKPGWGELLIEPDEEKVFPIKVTVKVDTTGIPSGPKEKKILVDVDGRIHMVEVFLAVTKKVVASATPTSPPTKTSSPAPSPAPPTKTNNTIPVVLGAMLVLGAIVWGPVMIDSANQQAKLERSWQQQSATQVALRNELSLVQVSNVRRVRCQVSCEVQIRYTVTNNSSIAIGIHGGMIDNFGWIDPGKIEPGQTQEFATEDYSARVADGNRLVPDDGRDSITSQLCLDFWTIETVPIPNDFSRQVGPVTVCKDIPDELSQ